MENTSVWGKDERTNMKYLLHYMSHEMDNNYYFFETEDEARQFIRTDFEENFEGGVLIEVSHREYMILRSKIQGYETDEEYMDSGLWDWVAFIVPVK